MFRRVPNFFNFMLTVPVFTSLFLSMITSEQQDSLIPQLSEYGSEKPSFTIYTNPAEDCSVAMNISWATPPGKICMIEVTDEITGNSYNYEFDEGFEGWEVGNDEFSNGKLYKFPLSYRCETFNEIPSKLRDDTSVTEMHIFDKHGFELFDLNPDSDYSYRIITIDEETGEKEYSDVYRFFTAGAESWKAAVIGDFHHYSPLWKRLDAAMGMLNVLDDVSGGFDWILSTGDVCAYGGSYNYWTELSEQDYFQNYMWASVSGNHDVGSANNLVSDNFFRDSHYFPHNGYEGQEGISYWFRYGDVLFIMLNNGAMRSSEGLRAALQWMEGVARENPSKYLVVVEHNEWISGTDGKIMQLERFKDTFDRIGVDLAISGNNHVYLRTPPLRNNTVASPDDGTFYVVTPSSDGTRGREMRSKIPNNQLIEKRWTEGANTVGAMIMDVNPQRIEMTLYNREGEVIDSFIVPAKR